MLRPMWKLCSPTWLTQPAITSSIAAGSIRFAGPVHRAPPRRDRPGAIRAEARRAARPRCAAPRQYRLRPSALPCSIRSTRRARKCRSLRQRPCRPAVNQGTLARLTIPTGCVDRQQLDIASSARRRGDSPDAPGDAEMRTRRPAPGSAPTTLVSERMAVGVGPHHVRCLVEMQLARTAIIIKPVGEIGRLLDFQHCTGRGRARGSCLPGCR